MPATRSTLFNSVDPVGRGGRGGGGGVKKVVSKVMYWGGTASGSGGGGGGSGVEGAGDVGGVEAGVPPQEMVPTPPGGEGDGGGDGAVAVVLAVKKFCKKFGKLNSPADGIAYSLFRLLYSSVKKRCTELSLRENCVVVKVGGMRWRRCSGVAAVTGKGWVWSVKVCCRRAKSCCCALGPNSAGERPASMSLSGDVTKLSLHYFGFVCH